MNEATKVTISPLVRVTPQVVEELNVLMRQLTANPQLLTLAGCEEILHGGTHIFVAMVGGRVVGTASVIVVKQLRWAKGWLEDVVVDEDYRGRGIACGLMEACMAYGWAAGCSTLNLTSKFNREDAWRLYESLGFDKREAMIFRLEKG